MNAGFHRFIFWCMPKLKKVIPIVGKVVAILCGTLGILLYYTHRYIFKLWGSVSTEQILWHVFHSTEGVDSSLVEKGYRYLFWVFLFTFLWVLLVLFPKKVMETIREIVLHPMECLRNLIRGMIKLIGSIYKFLCISLPLLLILMGSIFLICQWSKVNKDFGVSKYISAHSEDCKFIENHVYFPTDEEIHFDNGKKNLVIISGESLEETFNDSDIPGGPLLAQCAEEAKHGQSMSNLYSPGDCGWTISALTAWHFGLPLKTPLAIDGNTYNSKRGFLPNAKSIFDILSKNGYELVLVMGSGSHFSGKGDLFKHGNFRIFDKSYWEGKGYTQDKYKDVGWGYNDQFIFEKSKKEYSWLCRQSRPFVLFIESVNTHFPDGFCPKEDIKFGDIRDAYISVDKTLASFIRNVLVTDKAVVALIGDHYLMGKHEWIPEQKSRCKQNRRLFSWGDTLNLTEESREQRKLFNAFWGDIPALVEKKIVAPYDIAPTLLEASGARWGSRRYGLGVSFFSDEPSLIEEVGIDYMYDSISKFSKYYEKLY